MAKIILLLIIFISCASPKKDDDYGLSVKQRDSLFKEQGVLEELKLTKDQLFLRYTPQSCIKDWSKNVEELKSKLLKTVKNEQRRKLWYELGNCYILVGEYKLTMYYYDLVLGLKGTNSRMTSTIYFNMGQIYENAGRDFLAHSYYDLARKNNDRGRLSLFKLGVLEFEKSEYSISNKYFTQLLRDYPRSDLINFLIGVNYFHLGRKPSVINKVLSKLDEKSHSRILLSMAIDLSEKRNLKDLESDLKSLDVQFSIHQEFKSFLLRELDKSYDKT